MTDYFTDTNYIPGADPPKEPSGLDCLSTVCTQMLETASSPEEKWDTLFEGSVPQSDQSEQIIQPEYHSVRSNYSSPPSDSGKILKPVVIGLESLSSADCIDLLHAKIQYGDEMVIFQHQGKIALLTLSQETSATFRPCSVRAVLGSRSHERLAICIQNCKNRHFQSVLPACPQLAISHSDRNVNSNADLSIQTFELASVGVVLDHIRASATVPGKERFYRQALETLTFEVEVGTIDEHKNFVPHKKISFAVEYIQEHIRP